MRGLVPNFHIHIYLWTIYMYIFPWCGNWETEHYNSVLKDLAFTRILNYCQWAVDTRRNFKKSWHICPSPCLQAKLAKAKPKPLFLRFFPLQAGRAVGAPVRCPAAVTPGLSGYGPAQWAPPSPFSSPSRLSVRAGEPNRLKGQCHEIFDLCFFFMNQFPPSTWVYH